MTPGRELDALVAEKVMGYRRKREDCNTFWVDSDGSEPDHSHDYSTDISAAWQVVEKLSPQWLFCLENSGSYWVADFGRRPDGTSRESGETPAHAICLAALKAVNAI